MVVHLPSPEHFFLTVDSRMIFSLSLVLMKFISIIDIVSCISKDFFVLRQVILIAYPFNLFVTFVFFNNDQEC